MTVTSIRDAWAEVNKIFPTDYEHDADRSERAGYPHLLQHRRQRERLDQRPGQPPGGHLPDGKSVNIWIKAQAEETASNSTEEIEDSVSAKRPGRTPPGPPVYSLRHFCTATDNWRNKNGAPHSAAPPLFGAIKNFLRLFII